LGHRLLRMLRLGLRYAHVLAPLLVHVLVEPEPRLLEPLAHVSSGSNRRSWWCSRWPSFDRLVARYCRFSSCGDVSIGTCSTTVKPYPSSPLIFFGLLVRMRIVERPRSARIWLPIPYSRASAGNPSSRLASTVSSPFSCNSYALSLFSSPMPRPSCAM